MDLQTAIARKQQEHADLSAAIEEDTHRLDAQAEVIVRLQELNAQQSFSIDDINYLISVGVL